MCITAAVVTHGHHDHAHGLGELAALTRARTFAHSLDLALLDQPVTALDGSIQLDGFRASFIHTPGHTPGSVCIVVEGSLFTGDTLNVTGPGRHGAEAGAAGQLAESIMRLRDWLPGSTLVWPGHDLGPTPCVRLEDIPHRV
jgi:glyoxylase-like metal-dependent hydrolase (beta-lactamase superfamily II)